MRIQPTAPLLAACLLLLAVTAAADPAAVPTAQTPLAAVLGPDGTLPIACDGSFDARGWRLAPAADGAPRFVREASGTGVTSSGAGATTSGAGATSSGEGTAPDGPAAGAGSAPDGPAAAGCGDGWDDRFALRGVNATVRAIAVAGGEIYAAGDFTWAGDRAAAYVVRWDGAGWAALGAGVSSQVFALAVSGGDLYVGGTFTFAGGQPANRVARWDGAAWHPLGTGIGGGSVSALAVIGGDLYAGGGFNTAGDLPAARVARWDGAAWHPLGGGLNNTVSALATDGVALYVGGLFTLADGTPANRIARWDGAAWSALGGGLTATGSASVNAIALDGGNLYAGGQFTQAGGAPARNVARWDGAAWSALGPGPDAGVTALACAAGTLYAGGFFASAGSGNATARVARWDGAAWSPLADGLTGSGVVSAAALALLPGGDLVAGGQFWFAGGAPALGLARWNGAAWAPLGNGHGLNARILSLTIGAGGAGGSVVYAGGEFRVAGGAAASYVARWDPAAATWSALGSPGVNGNVRVVLADGNDLYVGGTFSVAGLYNAYNVARWDGTTWSRLGTGTNGQVESLALLPDGAGGNDLLVGGLFTLAGGVTVNRIARWDGATWSALGSGVNGIVEEIAVADNGAGGHDIYAGGQFTTAGGLPASRIARWDGLAWSPLGSGLNGVLDALWAAPDGAGGHVIYAGGLFTTAGGVPVERIAQWDGTAWSPLGAGLDGSVNAIAMRGTVLYAGGGFTTAGGVPAAGIARWDGTAWSALGAGVTPGLDAIAIDGGHIYGGGTQTTAGCVGSVYFSHFTDPVVAVDGPPTTAPLHLAQNHPNPFNPATTIGFRLPAAARATLRLHDARGRAVATLLDRDLPAGEHTVRVDARGLASGVYLYTLRADNVAQTRKMMLLR